MISKEKVMQKIELMDQIMTMLRDLRASEMAELEDIETKTFENQCNEVKSGGRSES
jgi:hypothetical protein